jgi:hypothetical protein
MGLQKDCLPELTGMDRESFDAGYRMRSETADMEKPDDRGHGECHIAFLMEAEIKLPFVRHKVSIKVEPEYP